MKLLAVRYGRNCSSQHHTLLYVVCNLDTSEERRAIQEKRKKDNKNEDGGGEERDKTMRHGRKNNFLHWEKVAPSYGS